ncbi:cell envelope integrity protein TolA [Bacillus sp. AGMB 02131]|uniref:Cell envelope integrity protein TolA n=1 Tax=Peribacillus faecalis TaxID=2772559 RepID=A0A927CZ27_9BACI|nr:cell envelope integrity protein TolA [Peribacillus faecalis]MBD3109729.1 cell envelope integrity protein TolA [Peribacillus faecalis]
MEHLFNLIFDNLWVVIILLGLVSSLFGGDKKQQKKKPFSETTQMPTMTRSQQPKMEQKPQQVKKVQEVAAKSLNKDSVKEELSAAQTYLAERAAMLQQKQKEMPARKPLETHQRTEKEAVARGTFSQNEVVNGVIMAEILGAPRAKKPYSQSRR